MQSASKMEWETKHSKSLDESYTVSYKSKEDGIKILLAEGFVEKSVVHFYKGKECAWYENDKWFLA